MRQAACQVFDKTANTTQLKMNASLEEHACQILDKQVPRLFALHISHNFFPIDFCLNLCYSYNRIEYIYNEVQNVRKYKELREFAVKDIVKLCEEADLTPLDTVLVLNGGTGVGKTTAIMSQIHPILEKKFNKSLTMLVVESRTATKQQLQQEYETSLENYNSSITVCQRQYFGNLIDESPQLIDYDFVIIDECHGLFSEATFADDAERIARWIQIERKNSHIIFVTANDTFFNNLASQYFTDLNYIYLFPDFTEYVTNTYVREIQWIRTKSVDPIYQTNYDRFKNQKGIIFVKSAREANTLYSELLERGVRAALIVSLANSTKVELAELPYIQEKTIQQELSDMKAGFTLADACEMIDKVRAAEGLEKVRDALIDKRIPSDINVLIATDTIQEGISIESPIDYIFIEGFTEEEVEQKAGRYRGNLDLLYIIFCPQKAQNRLNSLLDIFRKLEKASQMERAVFYGAQQAGKYSTLFLIRTREEGTSNFIFEINRPAYLKLQHDFQTYTALMTDPEAPYRLYGHKVRNREDLRILSYKDDVKGELIAQSLEEVVKKWRGKPLKGYYQEEFIEDCYEAGVRTNNNLKPGFKKCLNEIKRNGYKILEKQATAEETRLYSFLQSRDKYKIIV